MRMNFFFLLLAGFAFSCNPGEPKTRLKINDSVDLNIKKSVKHADLFDIKYFDGYKKIIVYSPWNNRQVYYTYILIKDSLKKVPVSEGEIVINTPVKNIVALSATYIGLFDLLDLKSKITGIGSADFIYNEEVRERIKLGEIKEVGFQDGMSVENLIEMAPGLVMTTGYENMNENLKMVEKSGVPVAYNLEYMEHSLLARAEWIKFIAAFFDCDKSADSIFNNIESEYLQMKELAQQVKVRPKVLTSNMYKGTWFVPGGNSYMAELLNDAGADYYWKNDTTTGSLSLSFEMVLEHQMDAAVWINPSRFSSLESLLKEDEKYNRFEAFKKKNVYNFIKRELPSGANDYWESGLASPHLLLADLIKIFHPELLPDHELIYYKKLE